MEAEDVDLGEQDALALDVDGEIGVVDDDPEALESDDEEDEQLGIDMEESDGMSQLLFVRSNYTEFISAHAHCSAICAASQRETDAGIQASTSRASTCCRLHQCRRNLANHPRYPVRRGQWARQRGKTYSLH